MERPVEAMRRMKRRLCRRHERDRELCVLETAEQRLARRLEKDRANRKEQVLTFKKCELR